MKNCAKEKILGFAEKNWRRIGCILFILYSLFVLAGFFSFKQTYPFAETACINNPISQDDYSLHFRSTLDSSFFLSHQHRLWGYDPFFSAGYPSGTVSSLTTQWTILFDVLLGRFFSHSLVFNLSIFAGLISLPILAFFSARQYGLGKVNSLAFFTLSIALLAGFRMMRSFTFCGMYGFLMAVFLSLFTSSCFFRYCKKKRNLDLMNMAVFGSLALWVHPFSAFVCSILCGPVVICRFRTIYFRDICKFMAYCSLILMINLLWIAPFLRFRHLMESPASNYLATSPTLIVYQLKDNVPFVLIMLLFVYVSYSQLRRRDYDLVLPFSFSFLILFAVSFFGSQIGVDYEPARYLVPLVLSCVLIIASSVREEWEKGNVLFGAAIFFLFCSLLSRPVAFTCGYEAPEAGHILHFLKTSTSKNARIHVQDSSLHPYFGSHFTSLIPEYTSRQILAAPYTYPPTKFKFTQFVDDTLFEKRLQDLAGNQLEKYLELYNIKYFLVFGNEARSFFDGQSRFKLVFVSGKFRIYDYLDSDESFCYRCNATITADYDRIVVDHAPPGSVVLKYHYIDTLTVEPANIRIRPINILDDPVPFIMVENGDQSNFVIINK